MVTHANLYLFLDTITNEDTNLNMLKPALCENVHVLIYNVCKKIDSDKPGHPCSLVRAFIAHTKSMEVDKETYQSLQL